MNLSLSPEKLSVCQLAPDAPIPGWSTPPLGFVSITRTREELSIVCATSLVPAGVKQETGWRMLQLEGPLDFNLTGILASLLTPLAKAGVSIFALSTYNTDYVLLKDEKVAIALPTLRACGHTIRID